MLFELVVKGSAADAELLGGLFFVALSAIEGHQDKFFLNSIKSHPIMNRSMLDRGIGLRRGSNSQGKKFHCQFLSLGHKHGPLDYVL